MLHTAPLRTRKHEMVPGMQLGKIVLTTEILEVNRKNFEHLYCNTQRPTV